MPIYHLDMTFSLHLGEYLGVFREAVLDRVPSDSLFAAVVTAWTRLDVDIGTRLAGLQNGSGPQFTVSSAFPRAGDVRFYPAPPRLPAHAGFPPGDKGAKRVRWLSEGVLSQLRAGQHPERDERVNFLHGATLWLTRTEFSDIRPLLQYDKDGKLGLWKEQTLPRVTVDRVTHASNLFFAGKITFSPGCGLWFAARGQTDWIDESLDFLQDEGLGGLRSTGHGAFSYQLLPDGLDSPADGWGYSLARYAPADENEILALRNPGSAYALESIGGWCQDDEGKPWRRRSVRLLAEGALLPVGGLVGKAVDTRPGGVGTWRPQDRGVWRVGYPFFVPAGRLVEVTP